MRAQQQELRPDEKKKKIGQSSKDETSRRKEEKDARKLSKEEQREKQKMAIFGESYLSKWQPKFDLRNYFTLPPIGEFCPKERSRRSILFAREVIF